MDLPCSLLSKEENNVFNLADCKPRSHSLILSKEQTREFVLQNALLLSTE